MTLVLCHNSIFNNFQRDKTIGPTSAGIELLQPKSITYEPPLNVSHKKGEIHVWWKKLLKEIFVMPCDALANVLKKPTENASEK